MTGKPFLILQLRPEDEAADEEFVAFLHKGGLPAGRAQRIRLDREDLPADLNLSDYAGILVGGGPGCVSDPPEKKSPAEARIEASILGLMPEVMARDHPFMGCCYGIGILAHHLGAPVSKARYGEAVGPVLSRMTEAGAADPVLAGMPPEFAVLVGHKEAVQALPEGAVHLMTSAPCPYQMIRAGQNVYATQFHPEADGDSFALRIRVYRDKGYFHPDEADRLTDTVRSADVGLSGRVLANFVARYG